MFTGPMEDRLAIRELHDRYADAVLLRDAEAWGAVWTPDASWTLMGTHVEGREAIVGLWSQAIGGLEAVSFMMMAGDISLDGDKGTGRCQTQEIMIQNGKTRIIGGRYDDVYVKQDGEWLYQKRDFSVVAEFYES